MDKKIALFLLLILAFSLKMYSKKNNDWNGKKCAVVLTYDDALNVHLDNVIPCLDSADIQGTFYLTAKAPVVSQRMEEWRIAAENGHELGNHSLKHPCSGGPKRTWVGEENDLRKYTVQRMVDEVRITNTLLQAIDGKRERTYAYPCGDAYVDTVNYYSYLKNDFVGARGTVRSIDQLEDVDLGYIHCYGINGQEPSYMTDLVDEAIESKGLLVFLFHGVGGEHGIDVSVESHRQLVQYLAEHRDDIWIAPMVDVARYIKENQKK